MKNIWEMKEKKISVLQNLTRFNKIHEIYRS